MRMMLICSAAAVLCPLSALAEDKTDPAKDLVALERQAMDGWSKGDPEPFLAIADPEITYYHVMTGGRLDGVAALKKLFEKYRGRPLFDSYEITGPKVQSSGDVAVLTYCLVTKNGTVETRWNSTQVYQRKKGGWRVIHSHWSQLQPGGS